MGGTSRCIKFSRCQLVNLQLVIIVQLHIKNSSPENGWMNNFKIIHFHFCVEHPDYTEKNIQFYESLFQHKKFTFTLACRRV